MQLSRRLLYLFPALGAVLFTLLCYAYFIEPQRLVVNHETLAIKGWDANFNGLRIVTLGDIHGGSNGVNEEKLRLVVQKVNEQKPDVVVMLGDYVSENVEDKPVHQVGLKMPMATIADNLSGINAKYGVFAVLGNHDGWYDDAKVAAELTRVGYRVLQNEAAVIEKDGSRLRILGLKDHLSLTGGWKKTSADARSIVEAAGPGQIIALEHSPDILPVILGEMSISPDLKLMLAAHTHGGQMRFPIVGRPMVPSTYGQKYVYGHVRQNNVDLWVTSGIGCSILPLRFMVPPEIVVIDVRAEQ